MHSVSISLSPWINLQDVSRRCKSYDEEVAVRSRETLTRPHLTLPRSESLDMRCETRLAAPKIEEDEGGGLKNELFLATSLLFAIFSHCSLKARARRKDPSLVSSRIFTSEKGGWGGVDLTRVVGARLTRK